MIRQCPRCELRFRSEGELNEHLQADHAPGSPTFERYRYTPRTEQVPLYTDLAVTEQKPRRYLVVANQTLGANELRAEIAKRLELGPAEIHVIAPATHSGDYPSADRSGEGVSPATDEAGAAMARWRLRRLLSDLAAVGTPAEGEVGPPDPYVAAGAFLEEHRVDEVLFATLPLEVSRWSALDVPTRIGRRFSVPVTVVTVDRLPAEDLPTAAP